MCELINQIEEKLKVIFKYDQKYSAVIHKEYLEATFEYKDQESLVRLIYDNGNVSVTATKYEVMVVYRDEKNALISENKLMYNGWEELLAI